MVSGVFPCLPILGFAGRHAESSFGRADPVMGWWKVLGRYGRIRFLLVGFLRLVIVKPWAAGGLLCVGSAIGPGGWVGEVRCGGAGFGTGCRPRAPQTRCVSALTGRSICKPCASKFNYRNGRLSRYPHPDAVYRGRAWREDCAGVVEL